MFFIRAHLTKVEVAPAPLLFVVEVEQNVRVIEQFYGRNDDVLALARPRQTLHAKDELVNQLALARVPRRQHQERDLADELLFRQMVYEQGARGHDMSIVFDHDGDQSFLRRFVAIVIIIQLLFNRFFLEMLNLVDYFRLLCVNVSWLQIL